jgi:16S rRNA (cytosine967-C5)-methyltransferase
VAIYFFAREHIVKPVSPERLRSQARTAIVLIYELGQRVFVDGQAADRALSGHFRQHRKFGSHDRRFISETFFSLFRWWGWIQHLARNPDSVWTRDTARASASGEWQGMLLAARLLDESSLHPVAAIWKNRYCEVRKKKNYVDCWGALPLEERLEGFATFFGIERPKLTELVPDWFWKETAEAGDDLLEFLQKRPPLWLRAQSADAQAALNAAGHSFEPGPAPGTFALRNTRVNVYELDAYRDGKVEIQDLASQTIGMVCDAQPGERWWDACAGAGGKALQLGSCMNNRGLVLATDIRAYKLKDLTKRVRRAGLSNIRSKPWDGKHIPGKPASFDGVLVDAPCTCTGTWRRNPDARWTSKPEDVAEIADLQYSILTTAAPGVKIGGRLVYATCSFCDAENEAVIARFLAEHPDFALVPMRHPLNGTRTDGQVRVWPQDGDCDGTFAVRMIRN